MGPLSGRVYRVSGWRQTRHGPERVSYLRRHRPAAQRVAAWLDDRGQGPSEIDVADLGPWRQEVKG